MSLKGRRLKELEGRVHELENQVAELQALQAEIGPGLRLLQLSTARMEKHNSQMAEHLRVLSSETYIRPGGSRPLEETLRSLGMFVAPFVGGKNPARRKQAKPCRKGCTCSSLHARTKKRHVG